MIVATLRLDLRMVPCPGAAEKRRQLRRMQETLHRHFNVSVGEDDGEGGVDRATLLVAAVARNRREARETLERVADAVAAHPRAEILHEAITEV